MELKRISVELLQYKEQFNTLQPGREKAGGEWVGNNSGLLNHGWWEEINMSVCSNLTTEGI